MKLFLIWLAVFGIIITVALYFGWFAFLITLGACIGLSPGMPCCTTCVIYTDTFATLGGWTQDAGSWSATSSSARISAGGTNARLRANAVNPAGDGSMSVACTVNGGASGDVLRIILAYVDSSNYHFGQVTFGSSGSYSIWKRASGTNTSLGTRSFTLTAGSAYRFILCIPPALNVVSMELVGGVNPLSVLTTVPASATGCGIGTGGTLTGTAIFTSFDAEVTSAICSKCNGGCVGACNNDTAPLQLAFTTSSITRNTGDALCPNCVSELNGTFVVPLWGRNYCACFYWDGTLNRAPCGTSGAYSLINAYIFQKVGSPDKTGIIFGFQNYVSIGYGTFAGYQWADLNIGSSPIDCFTISQTIPLAAYDGGTCDSTFTKWSAMNPTTPITLPTTGVGCNFSSSVCSVAQV